MFPPAVGHGVKWQVFRTKPPNPRIRAARAVLPHDGILDYHGEFPRPRIRYIYSSPEERQRDRAACMAFIEMVLWLIAATVIACHAIQFG